MMKDVKILKGLDLQEKKAERRGAGKKPVHQGSLTAVIMAVFSLCSFLAITQNRYVFFSWPTCFFS